MTYYKEPPFSPGARREQQNFLDGSKAERPGPFKFWKTNSAPTSTAGEFCDHQNRFVVELRDETVEP